MTPKKGTHSEEIEMPEISREASAILRMVIIGAYVIGVIFTLAGIWLVYLGATGGTEFTFFGQTFKSENVGVAAVFLGAATIVLLLRRTLSSLDRTIKVESQTRVASPSQPRQLGSLLPDSNLELVGATFGGGDGTDKEASKSDNTLDIKVRNTGSKVGYIKRAIVTVDRIWRLETVTGYLAAVIRTGTYDVVLPIKPTPYDLEVEVSQAIKPNEVDRFGLRITVDEDSEYYCSDDDYLFKFEVAFYYDADNKSFKTGDILFAHYNGLQDYLGGIYGVLTLGGIAEETFARESEAIPEKDFIWKQDIDAAIEAARKEALRRGRQASLRNWQFIEMISLIGGTRNEEFQRRVDALISATERFEESVNKPKE